MDFLDISIFGWTAVLISVTSAVIASAMLMLGTRRLHFIWGIFCLVVMLWGMGYFFVTQAVTPDEARFWWKIAFVGIILNPVLFFHFMLEFANRVRLWLILPAYTIGLTFVVLTLTTDLLIGPMRYVFGFYYDSPASPLTPWLIVFFFVLVSIGFVAVLRAYSESTDPAFRKQVLLFTFATALGFVGGGLNFLPIYGIDVTPLTNLGVAIGWPIIGFTILKYKLFNLRVVTAQFLTLILAGFSIIQLVAASSAQEQLFTALILVVTIVVGVYLILSVRREVEQREEILRLYKELEIKNAKLTELDKLKSQFLSIATHELRTPLTIVRNFVSLLLDGTYGAVPPAAAEGARQIFERVTDMSHSVDTYLNVSRIEQGKISYSFEPGDIIPLVKLAVDGLKANAVKRNLSLTLDIKPGAESLKANIDGPKVTEVITNLIDNSIKYTPQGTVAVTLEKVGQRARMTIRDTGVGMSEKTQAGLFKLFSPGEDSKKINPASTGVGLYVSKAHVEAHKGTLTAASPGVGKGSVFTMELPLL